MQANWQALSFFVKGLSLCKSGRSQEALNAYNAATELDPSFASPWNAKGYMLGAEGRYREALAAYDEAIELDPMLVYAWNGKGYMLGAERRYPEALKAYRRAIELDPRFAYPWNGIGNVLGALGQYREALDAYSRAAELDPFFALPWYGRAVLLKAQPELEAVAGHPAQQDFCRAIHLRQAHVQQFPLPVALLLDVAGEFHLPLLAHRLWIDAGPGADGTGQVPGWFDRISEECEAPRRALESLDADPRLSVQEKSLFSGMIHYRYGDPLRAFECLDAVDSADETNLAAQYYLLLSLRGYGEPAEKETAFAVDRADAVVLDPGAAASASQLYYAGLLFLLAGQTEKAVRYLDGNGSLWPSLYCRWFGGQAAGPADSVLGDIVREEYRLAGNRGRTG